MPAMATPYVVPKVPLSKNAIASDIQPSIAQASISGHPCSSTCTYNCTNWCNVCDVHISAKGHSPAKNYYTTDSLCPTEQLCKFDTSNVEYGPVNYSPFKCERTMCGDVGKQLRTSKITSSPEHGPKKHTGAISKKLPSIQQTNENNPHEQYLREVEALRGKLRELKGTTAAVQRQLPEIPKDANLRSEHRPVSRSVMKALHEIAESSKTHSTLESKRIRHISDSDNCINPGLVYNAPKRPRDDSPKAKAKAVAATQESSAPIHPKKDAWCEPSTSRNLVQNIVQSTDIAPKAQSESSCSSDEEDEDQVVENRSSSDSTCNQSPIATIQHPRNNTAELLRYLTLVKTEDRRLHPSLRASLFAHIPPFIRFASDTLKAERPFPVVIQRVLKWKLTTITPIIVKKIVQNSGYKFIRRTPDWAGIWGKHMKSVIFRTLKHNQKLNHFPGTFQIGRKDRLWKNLQRYMSKYGKREFGFMPRTFVLPHDTKALRASWDKDDINRWIIKPPASARGSGIKVVNKWVDVPKKVPLVVQKYISNPYLINGNKFDLRLYVLVTSFDPLRIYIYDNGLVRFASVKYSDDLKTLSDRYIHLTNYSINKFSNSYSSNEDAGACLGHKWTLRSLWTFFHGTVDVDVLWSNLVDLVIKTLICGEPGISHVTRVNVSSRYCTFELFGVDVLLDENLKPWLLEVNISPSLHSGSTLDTAVKGPLVTNILNLVGYHIPDTLNKAQENEASTKVGVKGPLCLDRRLYTMGLSSKETSKHEYFSSVKDREMYLESILEELTPDDVRHLVQYEDELSQTGNFQRIFPTAETHAYHVFMEGKCYYNRLFDAWEQKYGGRREEGIALLRSLCDKEVHLDVAGIEPGTSSSFSTETSSFQLVVAEAPESQAQPNDTTRKSDELLPVVASDEPKAAATKTKKPDRLKLKVSIPYRRSFRLGRSSSSRTIQSSGNISSKKPAK